MVVRGSEHYTEVQGCILQSYVNKNIYIYTTWEKGGQCTCCAVRPLEGPRRGPSVWHQEEGAEGILYSPVARQARAVPPRDVLGRGGPHMIQVPAG